MEEWIDSRRVYEGDVISLRVGNVLVGERVIAHREIVEHPGGVAIVPVLKKTVVLVRQYRIAIARHILEAPAGKLEGGEDPQSRAHRELIEETGYRARRMVSAGSIYASVGYTSEEIHLFFAFDLEYVGQDLEYDENIDIETIPIADIDGRIDRNELKDAKTIVALRALLSYLRDHPQDPE